MSQPLQANIMGSLRVLCPAWVPEKHTAVLRAFCAELVKDGRSRPEYVLAEAYDRLRQAVNKPGDPSSLALVAFLNRLGTIYDRNKGRAMAVVAAYRPDPSPVAPPPEALRVFSTTAFRDLCARAGCPEKFRCMVDAVAVTGRLTTGQALEQLNKIASGLRGTQAFQKLLQACKAE